MKFTPSKHLSEGILRAYLDAELDSAQVDHLRQHLDSCPICQHKLVQLSQRAGQVNSHINKLASASDSADPYSARTYLKEYISNKENQQMNNKISWRNSRFAWAVIALLIILASSLAFPQIRAIATDFLGLFRVEKVTVVTYNPSNIPAEFASAEPGIEQLLVDDVQIESDGEAFEVVDRAQAAAEAGIPVRLPQNIGEPSVLTIQPKAEFIYTIDLPSLRTILEEMGKQDIVLPDFIHGQTVTADLPAAVTALYGDCQSEKGPANTSNYDPDSPRSGDSNCAALVQLASPTVNAPPGLDIDRIGAAFLELSGMTPEEAQRFSQTVDWTTTLVLPVPNYAISKEVLVDGVQGVLVQERDSWDRQPRFTLLWVKDGIVYSLSGYGNAEKALSIANSLK
jgi:hypothetical protein